jgi:hypothetical protein
MREGQLRPVPCGSQGQAADPAESIDPDTDAHEYYSILRANMNEDRLREQSPDLPYRYILAALIQQLALVQNPQAQPLTQFIADLSEASQIVRFVFVTRARDWIRVTPVDTLWVVRKGWTVLTCFITDRDDVVEVLIEKLIQVLAVLVRDIDPDLAHHLNR